MGVLVVWRSCLQGCTQYAFRRAPLELIMHCKRGRLRAPQRAPVDAIAYGVESPRHDGQRGRVAKSDAYHLWERMRKHETSVLLFANQPHVAFTNNRAERDLRMAKVKQKVSGCFRTRRYAKAYR